MAKIYPAEIARIDRSFFQISGLFCETAKGRLEEPKLIQRQLEDGRTLEISRPVNLGAFHLLLLEALAADAQRGSSLQKVGERVST